MMTDPLGLLFGFPKPCVCHATRLKQKGSFFVVMLVVSLDLEKEQATLLVV